MAIVGNGDDIIGQLATRGSTCNCDCNYTLHIHDVSLYILLINNKKDIKVLIISVVTCPAHAPEVELYSLLPGAAEMKRQFRVHPTDGRLHFAAVFSSSTHSLTHSLTQLLCTVRHCNNCKSQHTQTDTHSTTTTTLGSSIRV